MNTLPVERALAIYGTIANRWEQEGYARPSVAASPEGLSRRVSMIRIA